MRGSGSTGHELANAGDQLGHRILMSLLATYRPDDAVLSEEGKDDKARLVSNRVWIVDPLDGTREFGEPAGRLGGPRGAGGRRRRHRGRGRAAWP